MRNPGMRLEEQRPAVILHGLKPQPFILQVRKPRKVIHQHEARVRPSRRFRSDALLQVHRGATMSLTQPGACGSTTKVAWRTRAERLCSPVTL